MERGAHRLAAAGVMSAVTATVKGSSATVRVGVVGLGRMGRRHAENFATRVADADVVAVCSPLEDDLVWARTRLGRVGCWRDYGELLRRPDLDAVGIATPTTPHSAQLEQALAARQNVVFEETMSPGL